MAKFKKDVFARIIETPKYQILVTKENEDDEEESPKVTVQTKHEGITVSIGLGFKTEKEQQDAFNKVTEDVVLSVVSKMFK